MTELTRRSRDFIAKVDHDDNPTAAERARVRAGVMARVGVAATVGAVVTTTAANARAAAAALPEAAATSGATAVAAATTGLPLLAKALAILALVGAGTTAYLSFSTTSARAPAPAQARSLVAHAGAPRSAAVPQPMATEAAPPGLASPSPSPPLAHVSAPRAAADSPRVAPPSISAPVAARPAAPSAAESFDQETSDLASVLGALRDGHADEALRLLDDQDARYPHGALGEERSVSRVDALCALGRSQDARTVAAAFLEAHPRSLLAPRVTASCGAR